MFDHPLEQPADDSYQLIEASWPQTRTTEKKGIEERGGDLREGLDALCVQIAVEHPQHLVFDVVAPVERALVANESDDVGRDRA